VEAAAGPSAPRPCSAPISLPSHAAAPSSRVLRLPLCLCIPNPIACCSRSPHAFSSSSDGDGGKLNGGALDDNHGEALFVLAKLGCSSRTFHRISLPPLTLAAPVQGIQGAPPRK
jgi:hypothetical protein